ncbi:ferredoxin [Candidatus Pacearchaeota archaeon]|nr:ferredoxin [Candidatus Pacearchaeota archaeon]
MKIKVDKEKCIGCGACEAICPEIFKMEDGKAKVIGKESKCTKEAADSCPVQAIEVKYR